MTIGYGDKWNMIKTNGTQEMGMREVIFLNSVKWIVRMATDRADTCMCVCASMSSDIQRLMKKVLQRNYA